MRHKTVIIIFLALSLALTSGFFRLLMKRKPMS